MRSCDYNFDQKPTTYLLNPLTRTIGFELEISNTGSLGTGEDLKARGYTFTRDSSVNGAGVELISPKLRGDTYVKESLALVKRVHEARVVCDSSCGLHVHVDAVDLTGLDIKKLYYGFRALQDQIYEKLVTPSRKTNTYCKPLERASAGLVAARTSDEVRAAFAEAIYELAHVENKFIDKANQYQRMFAKGKSNKYNSCRYWAVNFHAYFMRGAVEFRLKEGTTDPMDLHFWPLFCAWFVQRIPSVSMSELEMWLDKPPQLPRVVESWTQGVNGVPRMPKGVLDWVKKKFEPQQATPAERPQDVPF